jgi:hypothetical protein
MKKRTTRRPLVPLARRLVALALAIAAAIALAGISRAETARTYAFELTANEMLAFEIPITVEHPGTLALEARWNGSRQAAFRIDGPRGAVARRSGASPLRLTAEIPPGEVAGPWTIVIRALPSRETAQATLTVRLPESRAVARPQADTAPPAPGGTAGPTAIALPGPWIVPPDAPPATIELFGALERYRALLVAPSRPTDACRWQDDLLRVATERATRPSGEAVGDVATLKLLGEMAEAVTAVDGLRTALDPVLAGPPPAEPNRRRAWENLRREPLSELERTLDTVADSVGRDHAPELTGQTWPARFVSCLTACERYFDERVLLGPSRAPNGELAAAQWTRILAAGEVLRLLSVEEP